MFNKGSKIIRIGGDKDGNIKICIFLQSKRKIIGLREYLNAIGHIPDPADKLLIGRRRRPPAPDLPIKTGRNHQANPQLIPALGIGPGNRPYHITGSIPDRLSDRVAALLLFVDKRVLHKRVHLYEFLRGDEVPPDELGDGEADGVLNLGGGGEVEDVVDYVQYHVLAETAGYLAQALGGLLADGCLLAG